MCSNLINLFSVGLLGELIAPSGLAFIHHNIYAGQSITKYRQQNNFRSRGKDYYENLTCLDLFFRIKSYVTTYATLECESDFCASPSKYILVDHIFNASLRILDASIIHDISESYINPLIDIVQQCAKVIISLLTGGGYHKTISIDALCFPEPMREIRPRDYLEGDNHVLSLVAAMLQPPQDAYVGVLFGGGATAAIFAAYHDAQLNYMKISHYDQMEASQKRLWGRAIGLECSIVVIDDNCGTSNTLRQVKNILKSCYNRSAKISAGELHWEKLLRVKGYSHKELVFSLDSIDFLTPWAFRHHNLVNKIIQNQRVGHDYNTTLGHWHSYSTVILSLLKDLLPDYKYRLNQLFDCFTETPFQLQYKACDGLKEIARLCSCDYVAYEDRNL